MVTNLNEQLRRDEGEVLSAYPDSLGYLTIGVGRLIDKRRGGGITPDESAYLLNNDIQRKTAEVFKALPWVKDLDQIRLNVLINMAFQLGTEGLLAFKTTLSLVQGGNYDQAARNMILSKWHSQTPERCERLAKQMKTGVWQ
jgi:lysozyme